MGDGGLGVKGRGGGIEGMKDGGGRGMMGTGGGRIKTVVGEQAREKVVDGAYSAAAERTGGKGKRRSKFTGWREMECGGWTVLGVPSLGERV